MARIKSGNELHPLHSRYRAIYSRCNNPSHPSYKNYGARGITLAEDLMPFTKFRDYVESLEGYDVNKLHILTLDKKDNSKGYCIGNLRWVDRSVQTANQRFSGKGTNTYTGVSFSKTHGRWVARIYWKGKTLLSSTHLTEEAALNARNRFIKENDLPHTIQQIKKV